MFFIDKNQVLKTLNTSKNGLKSEQVSINQKKYGLNILKKSKKESLIHKFFMQFKNLMVLILLISAVISISLALSHHKYADLIEGGVILFIVFLNATIGVIQDKKAEAALDKLEQTLEPYSKVIRDNKIIKILNKDIVVGDIIYLEAGAIVPADIRLIDSYSIKCNESSLTGESNPVEKNSEVVLPENTLLSNRKNMVYSGTIISYGRGIGVVTAVGQDTEMGKIAKIISVKKNDISPLEKSINKVAKITSISVLAICIVIFTIELLSSNVSFINALLTSIALAVAAIPESLPAVITIIMALGVTKIAKQKAIIKRLRAVETLGCCNIICSDKTGTLTQNKLTLTKIYADGRFNSTSDTLKNIYNACILCNNSIVQDGQIIGNNVDNSLLEYIIDKKINYVNIRNSYPRIHEQPFDSNRKLMSVIVSDNGYTTYTKGALDNLINKCTHILINGKPQLFDNNFKSNILRINAQMGSEALKVLGIAYKTTSCIEDVDTNLTFLGLVGLSDEPRRETKSAISKCIKAGLKPIMITGDLKQTAFAVAKNIGISSDISQVLTGEELEKLNDKQLIDCIDKYNVFARVVPEHKARIVNALKSKNNIVAMTGDGVNDAPSIRLADIGIAMGSGTDVTKSVADMVITDDNFATIVVAIEEGRKIYDNITKAVLYLLGTNTVEVLCMLFCILFMPNYAFLLPSQMLFVNLATDSLPAFGLGLDGAPDDVMHRPPRDSKKGLLTKKVSLTIMYHALLQTGIVMSVFCLGIMLYNNIIASTMAFYTICYMQWLHSLNCKTEKSLFEIHPFKDKVFNVSFFITLFINIFVSLPGVRTLFSLASLNLTQWITVFIASILIIPFVEIFKIFSSKKSLINNT